MIRTNRSNKQNQQIYKYRPSFIQGRKKKDINDGNYWPQTLYTINGFPPWHHNNHSLVLTSIKTTENNSHIWSPIKRTTQVFFSVLFSLTRHSGLSGSLPRHWELNQLFLCLIMHIIYIFYIKFTADAPIKAYERPKKNK